MARSRSSPYKDSSAKPGYEATRPVRQDPVADPLRNPMGPAATERNNQRRQQPGS